MNYPPPPRPNRTALYVAIGIIAVVLIGIIVLVALVMSFFASKEGKKMIGTISQMATIQAAVPEISRTMQTYVQTNGRWPESLTELRSVMNESAYGILIEEFTYQKPSDDAAPTFEVLSGKSLDMSSGGNSVIYMRKDFKFFMRTEAQMFPPPTGEEDEPIEHLNGAPLPAGT